jgi:hypothetical protein
MAIVQISKIQQRSGNLVDLPQLDDAELGWANDARRLFIGKTTPNENVEVLTSYSAISFSQIDGAVGNLNISNLTAANGQVLSFDGSDWVNRGGNAGGLLTLGDVGNVKIDGGAIGYVLQTDGTGNLSWAPKGTLVASILNISKANPAVVTTVNDNFFADGAQITILDPQGMTELAGGIYFANTLTTTTFALYTDSGLSTGANSISYNAYSYTTVSATTVSGNVITVANSSPFTANSAVQFVGNMSTSGITANTTYYVLGVPPSGTTIKIATSPDSNAANVVPLQTTSGLTAEVYQSDGQAVSTLGSSVTFSPAGGTNTTVQFNSNGSLDGSAAFVFNSGSGLLTLTGNANVGNLNATGVSTASRFLSNVANGTPPLQVTSITQVANLNVATSGSVVNGNSNVNIPAANGNVNISAVGNANILVVTGTGANITGTLNATGNANAGNLGTAGLIVATGNVTGGNLVTGGALAVTGNANVGNLGTARVIATGNISGTQLISNIATGTAPLIVTSTTTVANLAAATATTAGTVTTAAQPNITSVGTLTSLGVNGTVTAVAFTANTGVFTGNGSGLSAIAGANVTGAVSFATTANAVAGANVSGQVANALVSGTVYTAAQPNITSLGTLTNLTVSGNIVAGNISGNIISGSNPIETTGNANVGNLNTTGIVGGTGATLIANTLTTGGNTIAGAITGNWTLTAGSRLTATYADLAEYYEADVKYLPGTVLMFGGEKEVTLAEDGTSKVAGVVSTNPAYVMNATCPGLLTAVALQGRVPCKVRGKISKGDMLISGGNGFARPNQFPAMGTVIGKALQDFDGYEGVIEVAVGRL